MKIWCLRVQTHFAWLPHKCFPSDYFYSVVYLWGFHHCYRICCSISVLPDPNFKPNFEVHFCCHGNFVCENGSEVIKEARISHGIEVVVFLVKSVSNCHLNKIWQWIYYIPYLKHGNTWKGCVCGLSCMSHVPTAHVQHSKIWM